MLELLKQFFNWWAPINKQLKESKMKGEFNLTGMTAYNGTQNQIRYLASNGTRFDFYHQHMGSQCGAAILHCCYPANNGYNKKIADEFVNDLREYYAEDGGNSLAKVIMTAAEHSNLYRLLSNSDQWQFGTLLRNPNSGRRIRTFELDIAKGGTL